MQYADFSPPASPSLDQQRDALQKGLGRAMRWAMSNCLADDPLLDACLHDKRHDSQIDGNRGDWLWTIIETVGAAKRFQESILKALRNVAVEDDVDQLCQLAFHYAKSGDNRFARRLYEIVEQKPVAYCPWVGEEQLLDLDGAEAFLFIARVRGRLLENQSWDWDDRAVVDRAIEKFGDGRVRSLLRGASDASIRRFEAEWRKSAKPKESLPPSCGERGRAVPVGEILSMAESGDRAFGVLRGWGMRADEHDLNAILERLWNARDPKFIANLLGVFANRRLPRFDPRLVELARHSDETVQRRAIQALAKNPHPLVREFALQAIREHPMPASAAALFIKNFIAGDENWLLEFVDLPADDCQRHWILWDALEVLEKNPAAECSKLAMVVYAETPCEACRLRAVELLMGRGVAPEWLAEECQHDSNEDCREFVQRDLLG